MIEKEKITFFEFTVHNGNVHYVQDGLDGDLFKDTTARMRTIEYVKRGKRVRPQAELECG